MKRFPGGLVFKAHRRLYHSNLGLRAMKKQSIRPCPPGCSTGKSLKHFEFCFLAGQQPNSFRSLKYYLLTSAGERERSKLNGCKDIRSGNGSSQGQNMVDCPMRPKFARQLRQALMGRAPRAGFDGTLTTSLTRNCHLLSPCSRPMPRALCRS